jgi:hypothetical protein
MVHNIIIYIKYKMTIKQLTRMHASFLSEFNRAVIRRRKNIKKVMANHLALRRRAPSPADATTPAARKAKRKLYNTVYRSVMNKAMDAKCGRWTKSHGTWGVDRRCQT